MSAKGKIFKTKSQTAAAVHLQQGGDHAVAIWNLSVLIVPDGDFWFAQALEIDYGAQGSSIEDAKKHFEEGLAATIHQHLKVHGDIQKLLKFAPNEILREAAAKKSSIKPYLQVSFHKVVDEASRKALPFDGIDYRLLQIAPVVANG